MCDVCRHDSRLAEKAAFMSRLVAALSVSNSVKGAVCAVLTIPTLSACLLVGLLRPDTAKRVALIGFVCISWLTVGVALCSSWSLMKVIERHQVR